MVASIYSTQQSLAAFTSSDEFVLEDGVTEILLEDSANLLTET